MGSTESKPIDVPPCMQYQAWRRMCPSCLESYVTTELMLKNSKRFEEMEETIANIKGEDILRIIPKNIGSSIEEMKNDLEKRYPEASWQIDLSLHLNVDTEREYGVLYGYTYLCDNCANVFKGKYFSSEKIGDAHENGYSWETPLIEYSNYLN